MKRTLLFETHTVVLWMHTVSKLPASKLPASKHAASKKLR